MRRLSITAGKPRPSSTVTVPQVGATEPAVDRASLVPPTVAARVVHLDLHHVDLDLDRDLDLVDEAERLTVAP